MAKFIGRGVTTDKYLDRAFSLPGRIAVAFVVILLGLELILMSPLLFVAKRLWRLPWLELAPASLKT